MIESAEIARDRDGSVVLTVIDGRGRELVISVSIAEGEDTRGDGAFVVFLDTAGETGWEPIPNALRVNVNDGPVFNYPSGTNHYGEDIGIAAPAADH